VKKLLVLIAVLAGCGVALAASTAEFVSASSDINSNGFLVVTFKEAGAGSNVSVNYTLMADASAQYACVSQGHGKKTATGGTGVNSPVVATATLDSGRNGRVVGGLATAPPDPGNFSCPNGSSLQLASVSYTNVQLTDDTNGVTAPLTGNCAGTSGCTDVLIRQ
jgi:hypothetical protein